MLFYFHFDTTDRQAKRGECCERGKNTEEKGKKRVVDTILLMEGLVACHTFYVYPILTMFCDCDAFMFSACLVLFYACRPFSFHEQS